MFYPRRGCSWPKASSEQEQHRLVQKLCVLSFTPEAAPRRLAFGHLAYPLLARSALLLPFLLCYARAEKQ